MGDFIEKRKFKRLALSLPVKLRRILSNGEEEIKSGVTGNISYSGVYVKDIDTKDIKPDDNLHISISVSKAYANKFPFSRLIGKARVVRAERDGIAFEFNKGIYRLSVAN